MTNIIIENLVNIAATLLLTLIGVLGAWLTVQINKRAELKSIGAAMDEVISLAGQTVLELQQQLVEGLKAAHEDGKLTKEEITALRAALITRTKEKMSAPAEKVLNAAGVDIEALIKGAGEAWIAQIKQK